MAGLLGIGPDVHRLHRRGHAQGGEPLQIIVGDQLHVLQTRDERRAPDGRPEDIERHADRGIADGVDDRGDPGLRRPRREVGERFGFGHPDPEAVVGRRRLARQVERLQQRRGAGAERAVGEALEPAQSQPVERIRAQRLAAAQAGVDRVGELLGPEARMDADAKSAVRGQRAIGGQDAIERRVQRQPARVVERDEAQAEELGYQPLDGRRGPCPGRPAGCAR